MARELFESVLTHAVRDIRQVRRKLQIRIALTGDPCPERA